MLWTPAEGAQNLGTLGGTTAHAAGINGAGQVVGSSNTQRNLAIHAFLWTPGQGMQDLGTLGGGFTESAAYAINESGWVVGQSWGDTGIQHAFLWKPGLGMQDLGTLRPEHDHSAAIDINDAGQVVGESYLGDMPGTRAFLWTQGQGMQDLGTLGGGFTQSGAYGINESGWVVGESYGPTGFSHAFLWTPMQGMRDLGTPGSISSVAGDIDDGGLVVGQTGNGDWGPGHAFVWTATDGMQDLFHFTEMNGAVRINNRQQVVGGNRMATLHLARNNVPVANAGGPYAGAKKKPVAFDGTRSADPEGGDLTYVWDFGDGSPPGSGATPTHEYDAWGTYNVSLTVSDPAGLSATQTTTATIAPPGHLKTRP
jgi:probable HAF family extracellular repeat protein